MNFISQKTQSIYDFIPNVLGVSKALQTDFPHGVKIIDPWNGDAGSGKSLIDGALSIDGAQCGIKDLLLGKIENNQEKNAWLEHLHSFTWLRDLKALGGEQARITARKFISSWMESHTRKSKQPNQVDWQDGVVGTRLSMWASHYQCFVSGANDEFRESFFQSISLQAKELCKTIDKINTKEKSSIDAACGLVVASVIITGGEKWMDAAIESLKLSLGEQILADGGHASRSPSVLCAVLSNLIFVKYVLTTNGLAVPEFITSSIEKTGSALRFFRYSDKGLALFHGSQEGARCLIDSILSQAGAANVRTPSSLPNSGYERLAQGKSVLLMDVGASAAAPFDKAAHASPLAFEFCHGKERVFVSCGSYPLSGQWREVLRATPAHCTLTVGNRNACEIGDSGGFTRRVQSIASTRDDAQNASIVEGCHDGYVPACGISHRRRVYLTNRGQDLRGQETLTSTTGAPIEPISASVRFHLHPRVSVALVRDGTQALLRIPGGQGWSFMQDGATLSLENSIYLGSGANVRKTKQIVLNYSIKDSSAVIKWALQRCSS